MTREKAEELRQLDAFLLAVGLTFDEIICSESPDFIVRKGDKTIGIELTLAEHARTRFGALEIEKAQANYAEHLFHALGNEFGVSVTLALEAGVPVKKEDYEAVDQVAQLIRTYSERLGNPGALTIWAHWHSKFTNIERPILQHLPDFIQNICLLKDGVHPTTISAGRGGCVPEFNDFFLLPILEDKNLRLANYEACSEHWLVIVAGVHRIEKHRSKQKEERVSLGSFATSFVLGEIVRPIPSDFDRTYFFKWPAEVVRL